jgi:hypothetical protein
MAYNRDHHSSEPNDDDWVDEKALEAAKLEAQVWGKGPNGEGETPRQTLRRLFTENSTTAALNIIKLSNSASSERIRLDASKYIVERVLGPLTADSGKSDDLEPGSIEHTLNQMQKNMSGEGE